MARIEQQPAMIEKKGFATSAMRAERRLAEWDLGLEWWRRKVHLLRTITAGDFSPVDPSYAPQNDPISLPGEESRIPTLQDILVTEFTESCENMILQSIRTLVSQCAARMPEWIFEDMDPEYAQFHQSVLASRYGPTPVGCGTLHHRRLSLLDYMIGGIGFTWDTVRRGKICTVPIDSHDVTWPCLDVNTPADWSAIGLRQTRPLYQWIDTFGKEALAELVDHFSQGKQHGDDAWMDASVTMQYYWDTEGEEGSMHVWPVLPKFHFRAILSGPNPHQSLHNGYPEPFLPITENYHMRLPSVRNPIGIAEMMLPAQIAVRRVEKRFADAMSKLRAFWDIEEGSYGQEMLDRLEAGEDFPFLVRQSGKAPARLVEGGGMTREQIEYRQQNREALIGMGGANPYATGGNAPRVSFAAETNAIRESAGLMVSTVAADHADDYRRGGFKALSNALFYDTAWLRVMYHGTALVFGPERPVSQVIDPVTVPSVSDDSSGFVNKERAVLEASNILSVAMPFQGIFPQGVSMLFEDFLRAARKKNVSEYMATAPAVSGSMEANTSAVQEQSA